MPIENNFFLGTKPIESVVDSVSLADKLKDVIANNRPEIASLISRLIGISFGATVSYFLFRYLIKHLDPSNSDKLGSY